MRLSMESMSLQGGAGGGDEKGLEGDEDDYDDDLEQELVSNDEQLVHLPHNLIQWEDRTGTARISCVIHCLGNEKEENIEAYVESWFRDCGKVQLAGNVFEF